MSVPLVALVVLLTTARPAAASSGLRSRVQHFMATEPTGGGLFGGNALGANFSRLASAPRVCLSPTFFCWFANRDLEMNPVQVLIVLLVNGRQLPRR